MGTEVDGAGMYTSVEAVGIPPHQLDAVFQSLLVVPVQVPPPVVQTDRVTFCVNVFVQLVVGLVMVIPVICRICPLFAAVRVGVEKLDVPPEPETKPVMGD